jgi:hypothetical protein
MIRLVFSLLLILFGIGLSVVVIFLSRRGASDFGLPEVRLSRSEHWIAVPRRKKLSANGYGLHGRLVLAQA